MTIFELVTKWDELIELQEYDESAFDELSELSSSTAILVDGYNYILRDGLPCRQASVKDVVMLVRTILQGVHESEDLPTDNKFNSPLTAAKVSVNLLLEFEIKLENAHE